MQVLVSLFYAVVVVKCIYGKYTSLVNLSRLFEPYNYSGGDVLLYVVLSCFWLVGCICVPSVNGVMCLVV
jgi:hypothetical protein